MTMVANDGSGTVEKSGGSGGGTTEEVALKKGPWTAAEDAVLVEYVTKNGEGNWNAVQRNTGLARCGKSCRLRWANHLRPNLKKGAFSAEEEKLILDLHSQFGNKWARMATLLPGRTDNEIKNYWNTRVKRRQRQGLPLYSDDCDRPSTPSTPTTKFEFLHMNHHQPVSPTPSPHSPLSSPLQPKPIISPQPFSDLNHLSSSSPYPFTFQRPTPLLCNPLGFKRYRLSSGCSLYLPPSTQSSVAFQDPTLTNQLAGLDGFSFPAQMYNSNSSHIFQTPLEPSTFATKLDLPSNQFSHTIEPDINIDMQLNDTTLQTSSGLPGGLLVDAQALASGQTNSKKRSYMSLNEGNDVLGALDDLSLNSFYWSSPSGSKPKEEAAELSRPMNDDLSTWLTAMPSSNVQVSDWHNGSAPDFSNVQSSSITTDDNFFANTTTNHNDTSVCFSWDNLPGLC